MLNRSSVSEFFVGLVSEFRERKALSRTHDCAFYVPIRARYGGALAAAKGIEAAQ